MLDLVSEEKTYGLADFEKSQLLANEVHAKPVKEGKLRLVFESIEAMQTLLQPWK